MFTFLKSITFTFLVLLLASCGSIDVNVKIDQNETIENNDTLRVACVGDSITEGVELSDSETYPTQLGNMLGEGYEVQNFGKQSTTVMKNGSLPYWNTVEYVKSLSYNPDIVVVMLGTNDARPENWENNSSFVIDYEELIESYKNLSSKPIVYIAYPTPVYGELYGITNDRVVGEVIPGIIKVAENKEVRIIDTYTPLVNKISLFPDGLHPNKEGARLIAEQIYGIIY